MPRFFRFGLLLGLLLAGPAAQAQSLADARAFVARLYIAYQHGDPDYLGRDAGRVFAPRLLGLIRKDAATTPEGEVGALDGDPICDCQDPDGLKAERIVVTAEGRGHAKAEVRLRFPSDERRLKLSLQAVNGQWRVADVRTADTASLVAFLSTAIPRNR